MLLGELDEPVEVVEAVFEAGDVQAVQVTISDFIAEHP